MVAPFALFVGIFNPLLDRAVVAQIAGVGIREAGSRLLRSCCGSYWTTSSALALVATTSMSGVCAALERLGLPDVLATQLLLLYRYIFVLGEETMRMARARALRSFGRRGMGMRVYVNMLGYLLLRTYAHAQRLYQAMLARGFDGRVRVLRRLQFDGRDVAYMLGWSAAFVLFRLVNVPLLLGGLLTELIA